MSEPVGDFASEESSRRWQGLWQLAAEDNHMEWSSDEGRSAWLNPSTEEARESLYRVMQQENDALKDRVRQLELQVQQLNDPAAELKTWHCSVARCGANVTKFVTNDMPRFVKSEMFSPEPQKGMWFALANIARIDDDRQYCFCPDHVAQLFLTGEDDD